MALGRFLKEETSFTEFYSKTEVLFVRRKLFLWHSRKHSSHSITCVSVKIERIKT